MFMFEYIYISLFYISLFPPACLLKMANKMWNWHLQRVKTQEHNDQHDLLWQAAFPGYLSFML